MSKVWTREDDILGATMLKKAFVGGAEKDKMTEGCMCIWAASIPSTLINTWIPRPVLI